MEKIVINMLGVISKSVQASWRVSTSIHYFWILRNSNYFFFLLPPILAAVGALRKCLVHGSSSSFVFGGRVRFLLTKIDPLLWRFIYTDTVAVTVLRSNPRFSHSQKNAWWVLSETESPYGQVPFYFFHLGAEKPMPYQEEYDVEVYPSGLSVYPAFQLYIQTKYRSASWPLLLLTLLHLHSVIPSNFYSLPFAQSTHFLVYG